MTSPSHTPGSALAHADGLALQRVHGRAVLKVVKVLVRQRLLRLRSAGNPARRATHGVKLHLPHQAHAATGTAFRMCRWRGRTEMRLAGSYSNIRAMRSTPAGSSVGNTCHNARLRLGEWWQNMRIQPQVTNTATAWSSAVATAEADKCKPAAIT